MKVTYTSRDGVNALDTGISGGATGSACMRYTTMIPSRVTTYPAGNTTERMKAFMADVQENAVLLQGLKRQSNPASAMRTLCMQAAVDQKQQKKMECGRQSCSSPSAMFEQDQSPLMLALHPALEKVSSVKEERPGGADVGCVGNVSGMLGVDKNMPSSLATRVMS